MVPDLIVTTRVPLVAQLLVTVFHLVFAEQESIFKGKTSWGDHFTLHLLTASPAIPRLLTLEYFWIHTGIFLDSAGEKQVGRRG